MRWRWRSPRRGRSCNIVDENGYAALAQKAADDPALQSAVAGELTTRAMALIAEHGGGRYPVDSSQVHDAAAAFTAGPSFPPLFAAGEPGGAPWLFADADGSGDSWAVDVAPMLNDSSFQQILSSYNVKVPATLTVPLTVSVPRLVAARGAEPAGHAGARGRASARQPVRCLRRC